MANLEILKTLDRGQLASYVSENLDSKELNSFIAKDKWGLVKILLLKKYFSDDLLSHFCSVEDLAELVNCHIEHGYTPTPTIISKLLKFGTDGQGALIKLFTNFSSLPVGNDFIFESIHSNCFSLASFLIVQKKKTDKGVLVAFFQTLSQSDYATHISPEFEEVIVKHQHSEELMGMILRGLKADSLTVSDTIYEHIVNSGNFEPDDVEYLCRGSMGVKALRKLHEQSLKSLYRRRSSSNRGTSLPQNPRMKNVVWTEEVEKLNARSDKYLDIDVVNPPKTSKFYLYFVARHPEMVSDGDLLEYLDTKKLDVRFMEEITIEILSKRSLDLVKKLDFTVLDNKLGLGNLFHELKEMPKDTAEYLYANIRPNYLQKNILKFLDPKNPQVAFEKMMELRNRSGEVRAILDSGYTIEEFLGEFKKQNVEKEYCHITFDMDFINVLTKEEFLAAMAAELPLYNSRSRYSSFSPSYRLKVSEINPYMLTHLTFEELLTAVDDKSAMITRHAKAVIDQNISGIISILSKEGNNDELALGSLYKVLKKNDLLERIPTGSMTLFSKFDSKIQKNYLEALSSKNTFTGDEISYAAKNYTSAEIHERVNILTINLERPSGDIINMQCKDGVFLVTDTLLARFFVGHGLFERKDAIEAFYSRSPSLFLGVAKAYIKGLDSLYEYGYRKPTRSHYYRNTDVRKKSGVNDIYKRLMENCKTLTDDGIEEAREMIGNGCTLAELIKAKYNHGAIYRQCDMDAVIEVDGVNNGEISSRDMLPALLHSKLLKFKVDSVSLTKDLMPFIERIEFNKFSLTYSNNLENAMRDICKRKTLSNLIFDFEETYNCLDLPELYADMEKDGIRFKNHQELMNAIITKGTWIHNGVKLKGLAFLADNGLIFSDKFCKALLECYEIEEDIVEYVSNRLGGLSRFTFNQAVSRVDNNIYEILIKHGAKVLEDKDYELNEIYEALLSQGVEFNAIDVSCFTVSKKIEIIRFIEEKVDPGYKKLNLTSKNLSSINILCSFLTLKESVMASNDDIIRIFSIPAAVSNNKKLMLAISEHVSSNPTLPQKVVLFKSMIQMLSENAHLKLDPQKSFDVDDYFDRSGFGTDKTYLEEKEEFATIPFWSIQALLRASARIAESGVFLRGQDKKSLMRFLRSLQNENESYLTDIFNMMRTVENGLVGLIARREDLAKGDADAETLNTIDTTIASVKEVFANVAKMDDSEDMHDRLVSLSEIMAQDPFQPLNQTRYAPLESDQDVIQQMGVKLLFPKTRGDLIEMGNTHGWCVSGSTHYGDEVISNNNILVGLVQKSKESTIDNVVALAHFINDEKRGYYLEQLRWSKLQKKGHGNVDATKDFNHKTILEAIEKFIRGYRDESRRAA